MGKSGRFLILIWFVLAIGPGCQFIWSESTGLDGMQGTSNGEIQPLTNFLHRIKGASCSFQGQALSNYGESLELSSSYGYFYADGCDTNAAPINISDIETSKFESGFVVYGPKIYEQTTFRYSYPFDDIPLTEVLCRDISGGYEIIVQEFNSQRVAKIYRKNQSLLKDLVTLKTNTASAALYEGPAIKISVDKTKALGNKFLTVIEGAVSVVEACAVQGI